MRNLDQVLDTLGIKGESLHQIRFGQGLVGKSAIVFVATMVMLSVVAYKTNNEYLLFCLSISVILLFVWYYNSIKKFTEKNPELALLEGGSLLAWKQIDLAAKGIPKPENQQLIENPNPDDMGLPIKDVDK